MSSIKILEKVIQYIAKKEYKLSKKYNVLNKKYIIYKDIKLLRRILDALDKIYCEEERTVMYRHYTYEDIK